MFYILVKSLKYKVRGSHKLEILSHFILRHKTHHLHHTRDFIKLLRFFKNTVAKWDYRCCYIKRHHAEQFINYSIFQL